MRQKELFVEAWLPKTFLDRELQINSRVADHHREPSFVTSQNAAISASYLFAQPA